MRMSKRVSASGTVCLRVLVETSQGSYVENTPAAPAATRDDTAIPPSPARGLPRSPIWSSPVPPVESRPEGGHRRLMTIDAYRLYRQEIPHQVGPVSDTCGHITDDVREGHAWGFCGADATS